MFEPKKLVFEQDNDVFQCETTMGFYLIFQKPRDTVWIWSFYGYINELNNPVAQTIEAAISAAQTHYNALYASGVVEVTDYDPAFRTMADFKEAYGLVEPDHRINGPSRRTGEGCC